MSTDTWTKFEELYQNHFSLHSVDRQFFYLQGETDEDRFLRTGSCSSPMFIYDNTTKGLIQNPHFFAPLIVIHHCSHTLEISALTRIFLVMKCCTMTSFVQDLHQKILEFFTSSATLYTKQWTTTSTFFRLCMMNIYLWT